MLPVLPLMDMLILAGWSSLAIGFVLKAVAALTRWQPTILTLSPIDFLSIAVTAFLFAIALAARTWVAEQQPAVSAQRRKQQTLDAYAALHSADTGAEVSDARGDFAAPAPQATEARVAEPAQRTG